MGTCNNIDLPDKIEYMRTSIHKIDFHSETEDMRTSIDEFIRTLKNYIVGLLGILITQKDAQASLKSPHGLGMFEDHNQPTDTIESDTYRPSSKK